MGSSKLPHTGTSIFTVMSALATEHGAMNLSQGFPDFPVHAGLIDNIHRYMREGKNQYAPMPGLPRLREMIAKVTEDSYGRRTDPDSEVTVFAGATEALFSTFTALVHPGDEVIVFDPAYDSYAPAIRLAGGNPVHIRLVAPDFSIPWERVRESIGSGTRAIVVNSPHNPTGSVISHEDMKELSDIAEEHDLLVVSDEVYERIIFEEKSHESVLKFPELRARSVAIFSFGKTFHATGWKIGYAVGPAGLMSEIRKIHQFVTFAVNTPVQHALADHLEDPANLELGKFYQEKRDLFLKGLEGSVFDPLPCYGTYFQLVQVRGAEDLGDMELARKLTIESKLASIPVSVFYHDTHDEHLLRFCFAKSDDTLQEAAEIIKAIRI